MGVQGYGDRVLSLPSCVLFGGIEIVTFFTIRILWENATFDLFLASLQTPVLPLSLEKLKLMIVLLSIPSQLHIPGLLRSIEELYGLSQSSMCMIEGDSSVFGS